MQKHNLIDTEVLLNKVTGFKSRVNNPALPFQLLCGKFCSHKN